MVGLHEFQLEAIMKDRRVYYAEHPPNGEFPCIFRPDELRGAQQALMTSQQQCNEKQELLKDATTELDRTDQKVADLSQENQSLR